MDVNEILEIAVPEVNNLTIDQLREKIARLETTEDGEPLKDAMKELKIALKANPAACSLMLDEDIGKCVHHLKRMTDKEILADLTPKARNGKDKVPKIEITAEVLNTLSADDFK